MIRSPNQASSYVPRRFTEHLEGKEGQILHAAFQCVVEKGIAGTSTHATPARAGLNQGIIHYYFVYYFMSKEGLLKRLVETLFQTFITTIETIARSPLFPSRDSNHDRKRLHLHGFKERRIHRHDCLLGTCPIRGWGYAQSVQEPFQ
jgi:AcrR family transcriptional regulator